ncbi:MAG TPA: hypothetical protein VHO84_05070, partial [Syntrophorhabdaceae bacterium]|nr:hypothetical protein [Syntrophorhabdaceae bacterium]
MLNNTVDPDEQTSAFSKMSPDEKVTYLEKLRLTKTEATGKFLNRVYPGETDKIIRKLIRRVIFQLKSAGVKVDEPSE